LVTLSPTYPGVYVTEIPSPVHPIVGVQTAVAAFVGYAPRGPVDTAVNVQGWLDYVQQFGGFDPSSPMSYAVYMFFLNGGGSAEIVRAGAAKVVTAAVPAQIGLSPDFVLEAASPGSWGNGLQVKVDTDKVVDKTLFNLTITDSTAAPKVTESYLAVGVGSKNNVVAALAVSRLVTVVGTPGTAPAPGVYTSGAAPAAPAGGGGAPAAPPGNVLGTDVAASQTDAFGDRATTGLFALAKADIFNMLCLPTAVDKTYASADLDAASAFCAKYRAMLIVDPPSSWMTGTLAFQTVVNNPAVTSDAANAATYYPNLVVPDPTTRMPTVIGPCGAVAGAWARTDQSRGVWKAPAGTEVALAGVSDLTVKVDDDESGILNPLAINGLRNLPLLGPRVWGARTAAGLDEDTSEWKYIPARRTALFIEESLYRGTRWVVFEPNDEPLWAQIRLNVGAFMNTLFTQGAFQGSTPAEAYLVKCDAENNPQPSIDTGVVNILVGFAPLYPAEFVFINIEQLAGSTQR